MQMVKFCYLLNSHFYYLSNVMPIFVKELMIICNAENKSIPIAIFCLIGFL